MPWNNNDNKNIENKKKNEQEENIFDNEGTVFIDSSFESKYSSSFDFDLDLIEFNQSYYSPFTGSFSETNFSTLDINLDYSESLAIDSDTTIFISQPNDDPLLGDQSLLFNSQSSLSFERDIEFSYSDTLFENFTYDAITGYYTQTIIYDVDLDLSLSESLDLSNKETLFISSDESDLFYSKDENLAFDRDIEFSYSERNYYNLVFNPDTGFFSETSFSSSSIEISFEESVEFSNEETLVIIDKEPIKPIVPTISIVDVITNEISGDVIFTVSLSESTTIDVLFDYSTSDDTAIAGSDYTATSGTLTIAAGQTTGEIKVAVLDDSLDENNESLNLNLSNAKNGTFEDQTGVLTINDNDDSPSISINDVTTNSESGNGTLTATLSTASGKTVKVNYSTSNEVLNFTETIITTGGADLPAGSETDGAYDVHVADIDSDGDMDIVVSSIHDDTIRWFENDGNVNPSFSAIIIDTNADSVREITVADMDGDGDLDIVSASENDDTIAWYENNGAADPTFTAANIATSADGAFDVQVADLDGDGDLDIVSASVLDDTIAWYENDGAANPTWVAADIATNADGANLTGATWTNGQTCGPESIGTCKQ